MERKAWYRNEVGLFRVDDPLGRIGRLLPGQPGYAAAALKRRLVLFSRHQQAGAVTTLDLPAGGDFGMYLIQNNSSKDWVKANPHDDLHRLPLAFFSFPAANPDRFRHLRQPSPGVVAWEDMTYGGDRDFNDAVVRMTFPSPGSPPTGTPPPPTQTLTGASLPVVTILGPSPGLITNGNVAIVGARHRHRVSGQDRCRPRSIRARRSLSPSTRPAITSSPRACRWTAPGTAPRS